MVTLKMAWLVVAVLLVLGAVLPMFTFTRFFVFNDTFSLITGIFHLLSEGEPLLFVIVFLFSVLMPACKMGLLFRLIYGASLELDQQHRYLKVLHLLGKWSMLDVFVVAILVVTTKLGAIADVTVHFGLYIFAVAVLASMLLTQKMADQITVS